MIKISTWVRVGLIVGLSACGRAPDPVGEGVEQSSAALSTGVDTSMCPPGSHIIVGTDGPDVLTGTRGRDCILGLGGNDKIDGRGGDDVLVGGDGDDVLIGGPGDDVLLGGDGNDVLEGGGGRDRIFGGDGNDLLRGGDDGDFMDGGDGNDVLLGGRGRDTLLGGAGDDVIDDGRGADRVDGGDGFDRCRGEHCESRDVELRRCLSGADCAAAERCSGAGVCVSCIADAECDDRNVCTTDACQPVAGCEHAAVPDGASCADATVCDGVELCGAGVCQAGTALHCDDGLFCDGQESCDAVHGCQPGTPPSVDDGVPCTVDSCDEATRSIDHVPNDAICGPGYACTGTGCVVVDECATGLVQCGANSHCVDQTPGSDDDGNQIPPYACPCDSGFETDADGVTCVPVCTPVTVGVGVTRCIQNRNGNVRLYLSPDGANEYNYWTGTFQETDEPTVNYCGPTAGRNFLLWYGIDASYAELGSEMRTNTWDGADIVGAALLACGLDPVCTTAVSLAVQNTVGRAGSLPNDVFGTLFTKIPPGYVMCANPPGSFDAIRASLANGDPIVTLVSGGAGNLHWEVITGAEGIGPPSLDIANPVDVSPQTYSNYQTDWSLAPLGALDLAALDAFLGIGNDVSFRWEKASNLPPGFPTTSLTICP
jgi:hypothetical protein